MHNFHHTYKTGIMASEPVATVVSGNTYTLDPRYDLSESRILGKGSFGVVCTAKDTVRGITLAVKRIRPYANDDWDAKHTLREVRLMRLLGAHPNVITLYELSLFLPKTELYMMIELMDSDLHRVIQSSKPLTLRHVKCFVKQMLEGVKAMHSIGVLHRDLKPGNILVSKDCQLRITDFGLARFMDDKTKAGENDVSQMTQYVVTRWYRPPELLLAPNLPYGEPVDLWSLGCILAEMINRKALFPGKDHLNQVDLIFQAFGYTNEASLGFPIDHESASVLRKMTKYNKQSLATYVPNATSDALNLMESLMSVDPHKRPTAEQALQHPFLADAEVLHDYSKTYLTRPSVEYFEFEYTPHTVPELRKMIHEEVRQLAADAYHLSPNNIHGANSPSSNGVLTPGELSVTSSSAVKRRGSETDGIDAATSGLPSGELPAGAAQAALHGDGPASQLPTARILNAHAKANDSIYLATHTSNSNILVPDKEKTAGPGEKVKKDNPFARPQQQASTAAAHERSTDRITEKPAEKAVTVSSSTSDTALFAAIEHATSETGNVAPATGPPATVQPAATQPGGFAAPADEHKKSGEKRACCAVN